MSGPCGKQGNYLYSAFVTAELDALELIGLDKRVVRAMLDSGAEQLANALVLVPRPFRSRIQMPEIVVIDPLKKHDERC